MLVFHKVQKRFFHTNTLSLYHMKTAQIQIRVEPELKNKVMQLTKEKGISLTKFIEKFFVSELSKEEQQTNYLT